MKTLIKTENFTICTVTVAELAKMNSLPMVQQVRGHVWPQEQSDALVNDLKDGKYIPPIVYTSEDATEAACVDGQQRTAAILAAYAAGKLTGREVVVIAISRNTIDDDFRRLNIGVPVAKCLVTAAEVGEHGDAILDVANHPLFAGLRFSNLQMQRCTKADMAMGALAICSGWKNPESSTKAASEWYKNHAKDVTDKTKAKCVAVLDEIKAAVDTYNKHINAFGKSNKGTSDAKHAIACLRKKNLFYTCVDAVADGVPAANVLAAYAMDDVKLNKAVVSYEITTNGKTTTHYAKWTIGGGSSGGNAEFNQRRIVINAVAMSLTPDEVRWPVMTEAAKAAQKAAQKAQKDKEAAQKDKAQDAAETEQDKPGEAVNLESDDLAGEMRKMLEA